MTRQAGLFAGRELRDRALWQVEETKEARQAWVRQGRQVAELIAAKEGKVTSDDVRAVHPVPDGWDPRILGAIFNAKRRGFPFVKIGYTQTKYKQAHARPIPIWAYPQASYDVAGV